MLPTIAVTMGDPAGVGPEICLRLLTNKDVARVCTPVIFGDVAVLRRAADFCELPAPDLVVQHPGDAAGRPAVLDLNAIDPDSFSPGTVNEDTGRAAYHYIQSAIESALAGTVQAVTTAPINKEALNAAGIAFPGHTEIFAAKTGANHACMMQYSEEITCSFATVHVGYSEVPKLLSTERILKVIELTREVLKRIRNHEPQLLVCGLNPHAGEHGLFGNGEEEEIIVPAIEAARATGIAVQGPLPPDTAFIPARLETSDAVVCMYHDQGHIPLKALAFDHAVNITLGLPIIRTSVDHGTALDIAWQSKANPSSLFAAVKLAAKLSAS